MDDASITELFRRRDERAIAELKRKYDKLCRYIAGNVLSCREDIEEYLRARGQGDSFENVQPAGRAR